MATKTYYHGTSADNWEHIKTNGLSVSEIKLWSCSEDKIYLWDADKVGEAEDLEDEAERTAAAFRYAFESAQFALITSKDCRAVVLEIELDEDEIEPDLSCENMARSGAVCIDRDISISEIKDVKISNDLSLIRGYFIAMMVDNQYNGIEFNRMELKIAAAFKNAEIYPDDIDDLVEWEYMEVPA